MFCIEVSRLICNSMLDFQPFLLAQQNKKENRNHRKNIYEKKRHLEGRNQYAVVKLTVF